MGHAHRHLGAEAIVTGEIPHATADMNVTPMDDRRARIARPRDSRSAPGQDDVHHGGRLAPVQGHRRRHRRGVVKVGIVTETMRKAGTATRNN
jgi:hypothetical protein